MTALTLRYWASFVFLGILTVLLSPTKSNADEALMAGVIPFICGGETVVMVETDSGWTSPDALDAFETSKTDTGWRFEDTESGAVGYLQKEDKIWVLRFLTERGFEEIECNNISDSVSEVVTIIKPKLDANITDMQEQFTALQDQLSSTINELTLTNAQLMDTHLLALERVNRLCIYMQTYRHLDVLDRVFPFGGEEFKLCP